MQLGIFLLPPEWDASPSPSIKSLYICLGEDTVKEKCLAQEQNTMSQPWFEPRLLDPDSSVLTMRQPHLIHVLDQSYCNDYVHKQIGSISNKHPSQKGTHT